MCALPAHSFFESGNSLCPLLGGHAFEMADYDSRHIGHDLGACLFLASQGSSPSALRISAAGIWVYSVFMGVRIDSRFVTTEETAKILGVSRRRVRELTKLMDELATSGHQRKISGRSRNGTKIAFVAKSASRSAKNGSPNRSKTRRGTQKRGKKAKATRQNQELLPDDAPFSTFLDCSHATTSRPRR